MILAKLRGGLSNQMFQYAAARRLAALHETEVRIDTSFYDRPPRDATPRHFELDQLRITGRRASRWETIGMDGVRNTPLPELPVAVLRKLRPRYRFVAERHFHFDERILALPDDVCLFGYFVSERYFADVAPAIRGEFRFRSAPSAQNAAALDALGASESVAVHVRRGDYTQPHILEIHGACDVDYYERAVNVIHERVAAPRFFVFSDEPGWAREALAFLGPDTVFFDHNHGADSPQDLRLMAAAKHQIIANSGFSWWGAWLNEHPGKTVVAPRRWMNDPAYDTSDVLPADWVAI